jgi:hypothetical protein
MMGLTVWPTRSLRPIWPIFRHTSHEPFKITLLSCWIENSAFLGVHLGLWTSQDWEPVFNQRNIFHGQPGYWGILNDSHEWDSSLPLFKWKFVFCFSTKRWGVHVTATRPITDQPEGGVADRGRISVFEYVWMLSILINHGKFTTIFPILCFFDLDISQFFSWTDYPAVKIATVFGKPSQVAIW